MANFKDSYRLERVYFEKLKSMISILKSFLDNETDEKTRAILANEIDDNGAILLLYRNLGEAWAELADLIQKLRNDLTALDEKEEAYHDELNERIDEVNNYLMALIRALEARMDAVEADLAQMGRLFTYDLAETSGVYSLTESGTAVTFADTVSKLTHVRPHFVSVRNGSKYYLIDTYDLTAGTGSVTWSGFEFTPAGEIKETIVTLAADNSVTVTQTSTNFASILSRLTAIETKITNFGDLPSNANAEEGDVLTVGANHVNVWGKAASVIYLDAAWDGVNVTDVELTLDGDPIDIVTVYNYLNSGNIVKVRLNSFFDGALPTTFPPMPKILDVESFKTVQIEDPEDPEATQTAYIIIWNFNTYPTDSPYYEDGLGARDASINMFVLVWIGTAQETMRCQVHYRNMIGLDFMLDVEELIEYGPVTLTMGLTLKERYLIYGDLVSLYYGVLRCYGTGNILYQLPVVGLKPLVVADSIAYELTFYNPLNSSTYIVTWVYNTQTDVETITLQ